MRRLGGCLGHLRACVFFSDEALGSPRCFDNGEPTRRPSYIDNIIRTTIATRASHRWCLLGSMLIHCVQHRDTTHPRSQLCQRTSDSSQLVLLGVHPENV